MSAELIADPRQQNGFIRRRAREHAAELGGARAPLAAVRARVCEDALRCPPQNDQQDGGLPRAFHATETIAREAIESQPGHPVREVMALTGGRCVYCGERRELTKDHQRPLEHGGTYEADNIVPACRSCNASKGTRDVESWLREKHGVPGMKRLFHFLALRHYRLRELGAVPNMTDALVWRKR